MHATTTKNTIYLDEPKAGQLTIQYAPANGECLVENPPRFTWLPVIEEEACYALRVSTDPEFSASKTTVFKNIPLNFFTPDTVLEAGYYYWSYAAGNPENQDPTTGWSKTREFKITANLPQIPLPKRQDRYAKTNQAHPRLWLGTKELSTFKAALSKNPDHCTWSTFFEKSVTPFLGRPVPTEPAPYPNNQRTPKIWRQTYIECQELIYAIRHLAIAGNVLEDSAMLLQAKQWLLAVADWDPTGTTSRMYTDEWAFRVITALAWGYDWLYSELNLTEQNQVRTALLVRTREVAQHVIKNANISIFPYDSHAVRSVSAVLVPACIAMLNEEDEAREWLDYSIEFLFTVYSPWGDAEGGWAEGPHYWMTGIAYLIDAANLLKNYTGLNLYERPFFQKTGDFPLYTKTPNTRRGTFGDDSTLGNLTCLKVGYNLRQFAGVTGNATYQWYYAEVKRNDPGTQMEFYNYGWWDLNFDEMVYQHDWPIVEEALPKNIDKLKFFKGIGWVAIQHRMDNPKQHIQFVFKSSPFGSISHSHGDQSAFCLSAFGEDLAIQSGHYVAFNSSMHQSWRRQTRSKNAILINGKGQYAGGDKALARQATGKIITAEEREQHIYIKANATAAYQSITPAISCVEREVYFIRNSYFVFVDSISATEPVEIGWLLHANHPFKLGQTTFRYTGTKAGFYGQFLWSASGTPVLSQETGFADVDPKEIAGLPESTCLQAKFPKSATHQIVTLLVPYPKEKPNRVFHFLDDQGYGCELYFTDADEQTFKVVVDNQFGNGQ